MAASSSMKVGILGGTFDPVHNGHLLVARDAKERLKLNRVLFLIAARPPHKPAQAALALRLAMLRAAIQGHAGFAVSDLETRRPGLSYTVESLALLRKRFPHDQLFLIVGIDQFRELASWHKPERLADLARVVVMTRPETDMGQGPWGVGRCRTEDPSGRRPTSTALAGQARKTVAPARLIRVRSIELSSTEIRARVRAGLDVRDMVPEPVRRLITRHRLYQWRSHKGHRDSKENTKELRSSRSPLRSLRLLQSKRNKNSPTPVSPDPGKRAGRK